MSQLKAGAFIAFALLLVSPDIPQSHNKVLHTISSASLSNNYSMRFYGTGVNDTDRIKISLDNPPTSIDVGSDFTIEFWIKTDYRDNTTGEVRPVHEGWITGHLIYDRDIFGIGDYGDYGISMGKNFDKDPTGTSRFLAFGVNKGGTGKTIVGETNVGDMRWHHVAVTRSTTSGDMKIYVDGKLDAKLPPGISGPIGDVSYRDGRSGALNDPFVVIAAEKHNEIGAMPCYNGLIDELRVSDVIRYTTGFSPPSGEFVPDNNTMALYHFNEGAGTAIHDSSQHGTDGIYNPIPNDTRPVWIPESPFTAKRLVLHGSDFLGNGRADVSVWRPVNGRWYIKGGAWPFWGSMGDIPVSGDYDGDGATDVAVFRPSNGRWYIKGQDGAFWGASEDDPVPGDYDGDGVTDIAVWRSINGRWYIKGQNWPIWGGTDDLPVPGDYNGDGTTEIAVWRPTEGRWYIQGETWRVLGAYGDVPVPGDYDGDGAADIAVWRPSTGVWYIQGLSPQAWGEPGDIPCPGDYDGDNLVDIAVFRPSNGRWYIKNQSWPFWGDLGDIPLVR